ncbi:GNAT family N-acetyltransferase [Natrinema sp. CBA1119]|uniref:GNAT family N-acetyltransferase n=1 Tax=Natrinema sp. CBA1119 TaxID=1608465 RepID=UPI000BF4FD23|nr:GNAT family N-acetyltransferase [Natrinema sp. CBA1119]PGF18309.1 GNAT family N-acetyltransferase [Natrinema sp. CBA1119]
MTRVVRRATIDDVWAVHEIARESWHAAYDDVLGPERVDEVVDDWYAIGDLESAITDVSGREDAAFLVAERAPGQSSAAGAERGSVARGFAHAVPWPEDTTVVFLARLYVRPDDWNEGIGTALLERLEADFSTAVDRIRLAVLAANQVGISFYESRGFDRVATRSSDLAAGLEEHVYERQLSTPDE